MKKKPLVRVVSHLETALFKRLKAVGLVSTGLVSYPLFIKRDFKFLPEKNNLELDFAWPHYKIGIEVQGGIDKSDRRSGHTSRDGLRRDYYKNNLAQSEGWLILWFPPEYCTDAAQWLVGKRLLRKAFALRGVTI